MGETDGSSVGAKETEGAAEIVGVMVGASVGNPVGSSVCSRS